MRQKPKFSRYLLIILPVAVVLIVCAVLGIVLIPPERAYRAALRDSRSLPYEEACASLDEAIEALADKPFFADKRAELIARRSELIYSHGMEEGETLPYEQALDALDTADDLLPADDGRHADLEERRRERIFAHAMEESETLPYGQALEALEAAGNLLPPDDSRRAALAARRDELIFTHAMEESETLPYEQARALLLDTAETLRSAPAYTDTLERTLDARTDAEIRRVIDAGETDAALKLLAYVGTDSADTYLQLIYDRADALLAAGDRFGAIDTFLALGEFSDAQDRVEAIRADMRFEEAEAVFTGSNYDEAIAALLALGTERGDAAAQALETARTERRASLRNAAKNLLSAGAWHTVWVDGGRVRFAGDARYTAQEISADRVYSGLGAMFAWKNGEVIPLGETFGCEDVFASLHDVADMGVGLSHALLLHADGTVTGVGSKAFSRTETETWTDMTGVAAGAWHSVGLKADGTVISCGDDSHGQCETDAWTGIVAVRAGLWHTVGLKADGTVVACGDNRFGQCDVDGWTDIVDVCCGACFTVGLRSDGTVVACGDNAAGQCEVREWTEIAAIAAGAYHTAAVRADGTLCSAGRTPGGPLPSGAIFASGWMLDPMSCAAQTAGETTAYIEGTDSELGPWLYLDESGAALICIDESEPRKPFRVDMLATAGALPGGRVTDPDAKGNVIYMPTEMVQKQARTAHAVVAFTGDYLGFSSNRKAVMIRNGVVYYDRDETTTLAVLPDGTLEFYGPGETSAQALLEQGVTDSFSFGPLLVLDGECALGDDSRYTFAYTMRVAFGYSDPYHYLAIVTLRDRKLNYTIQMAADTMIRYGARVAYNLDGGHSTALTFMGKELSMLTLSGTPHTNIRSLSDVVVFLQNDLVQPEDTP